MSDPASLASLLPVGPIQRVIVCGSRKWTDRIPIEGALRLLVPHKPCIIQGNARGADYLAGQSAYACGLTDIPVPVTLYLDGPWPRAGNNRNTRMLALSPNLVLAFKDGFDYTLRRGGTEHMCRIALESKPPVPVLLYSTARGWERLANTETEAL